MSETSKPKESKGEITSAFTPDNAYFPEHPVPFAGDHIPDGLITVQGGEVKVDRIQPEHQINKAETDPISIKLYYWGKMLENARFEHMQPGDLLSQPDNTPAAYLEKDTV